MGSREQERMRVNWHCGWSGVGVGGWGVGGGGLGREAKVIKGKRGRRVRTKEMIIMTAFSTKDFSRGLNPSSGTKMTAIKLYSRCLAHDPPSLVPLKPSGDTSTPARTTAQLEGANANNRIIHSATLICPRGANKDDKTQGTHSSLATPIYK